MGYDPENLEKPNKSETSKPVKQVAESTVRGIGSAAIKGATKK